jgi:hypothetical protein
MKKRSLSFAWGLLIALLPMMGFAKPSEDTLSADIFSAGNDFIRLYGGYDYSLFGDLIQNTRSMGAYYQSLGSTVGVNTDNSGILMGVAWGKRLDSGSELSLHFEVISSQADTFSQTSSGSTSYQLIGPNLTDLTLEYSFDILQGPGNRTTLSLGAGYYHALVDYTDNVTYDNPAQQGVAINGAMTGDTAGGTIGLSEQVQISPAFCLNLFVRGRYVNFSKIQASDLAGYYQDLKTNGPYSLAIYNTGAGYNEIVPVPNGGIDSNPGLFRYANLDYSGIDGGLSVEMSF